MIERRRLHKSGRGGARPGAGRKPGATTEIKRVARARATREGGLPHELLLRWARTGMMGKQALTPDQRISAAKGCAAWYKAPMQAVKVQGDADRPMVLQIDASQLRGLPVDKLELVREVLRMIQQGEAGAQDLELTGVTGDAEAYARSLH